MPARSAGAPGEPLRHDDPGPLAAPRIVRRDQRSLRCRRNHDHDDQTCLGCGAIRLRWTAWAFLAATTYLNIAAAHGSATAAVMHAAIPTLFVTVIEGIRHLIRQRTGLAAGTRIERIPVSRWLLAPRTTFLLARRMVLWHVTGYRDGLALEYQRLLAVSRLQQDYGRWRWRWRAPLRERLALRLMPTSATTGPAPADTEPQVSEPSIRLIEATASILADAERDGISLSQATLARQIRERGHRVGNDRLRWLVTAARAALANKAQRSEAA